MKNQKLSWKIKLIVLLLAAAVLSGCAMLPTTASEPDSVVRTITVDGEGTAYGSPDQVSIQIGVETFGDTVVAVSTQNEVVMQSLFEALNAQGVQSDDIKTSNYSVWTESQYGDGGYEGIAGYRVSNQLSIIVRNIDSFSSVLQAAMDAGANNIYGVTFGVSDPEQLRSEARQTAIENAERIAQELAVLSGGELDTIQSITELTVYDGMMDYARPQSGGGGDAPAPSIAPGLVSSYVQLQVTYSVR